jgi:hypothetical protein
MMSQTYFIEALEELHERWGKRTSIIWVFVPHARTPAPEEELAFAFCRALLSYAA